RIRGLTGAGPNELVLRQREHVGLHRDHDVDALVGRLVHPRVRPADAVVTAPISAIHVVGRDRLGGGRAVIDVDGTHHYEAGGAHGFHRCARLALTFLGDGRVGRDGIHGN